MNIRQEYVQPPFWAGFCSYITTLNPLIAVIAAMVTLIFIALRLPYMEY